MSDGDPQVSGSPPNIVMVVLDDVGFGQLGCYGSSIDTPAMDGLAAAGLRYSAFHTTGICSATRATLMTGRNHHAVGIGTVIDFCDGSGPGYTGTLDPGVPTLAERLRSEAGYATFAVGKWHLCSRDEQRHQGPFTTWPLARGFDRFYGFLGGATSQWEPDLVEDNHPRRPPAGPEDGYHLSSDLVDQAIAMIRRQRSQLDPGPFFAYLSFGCGHEPHHVGAEWVEPYHGRFDHGWDVERERVFERQRAAGIVPSGAVLPQRNPGVPEWASLGGDERRVFSRLQEVFAGFLTHCDAQVGRLVHWLRGEELLDDTLFLVLSDNGASPEGGATGFSGTSIPYRVGHILMNESGGEPLDRVVSSMTFDEWGNHVHIPEPVEQMLPLLDDIGLPGTYNHYPQGWANAGNTPFRRYKHNVHYGGTRDPLIVSWPAAIGDAGAVRTGFCHSVDVAPTCLAAAGLDPGEVDGEDLCPTFTADVTPQRTQYFEMTGHRAVQHGRWKAVAFHRRHTSFEDDEWELYDTEADPTEVHDLAADQPDRLERLVALWHAEAARNNVLPQQGTPVIDIRFRPGAATYFDFQQLDRITGSNRPDPGEGPVTVSVEFTHRDGDGGVLFVDGTPGASLGLCIEQGQVVLRVDTDGTTHESASGGTLGEGSHRIDLMLGAGSPAGFELHVDGHVVVADEAGARPSGRDGTLSVGEDPDGLLVGSGPYSGRITRFSVRTTTQTLVADSDDMAAAAMREQ